MRLHQIYYIKKEEFFSSCFICLCHLKIFPEIIQKQFELIFCSPQVAIVRCLCINKIRYFFQTSERLFALYLPGIGVMHRLP